MGGRGATAGVTSPLITSGGTPLTNPIASLNAVYEDEDGVYRVMTDNDYSNRKQFRDELVRNGYISHGVYDRAEVETIIDTKSITDLPRGLRAKSDRTLTTIRDYFMF